MTKRQSANWLKDLYDYPILNQFSLNDWQLTFSIFNKVK